jgi:carbon monoxide dehydrogenase subunit G
MKLENEFSVAAPLDQTWSTLLDIERVASCLPGAKLESESSDEAYRGEMTVKSAASATCRPRSRWSASSTLSRLISASTRSTCGSGT